MWVPERVWEQSLTADVVEAGIKYTVLDDFHFQNTGLATDQLHGYLPDGRRWPRTEHFPGQRTIAIPDPLRRPARNGRLPA